MPSSRHSFLKANFDLFQQSSDGSMNGESGLYIVHWRSGAPLSSGAGKHRSAVSSQRLQLPLGQMVQGHFSTALIPFLLVVCLTVGHCLNSLPSWRVYPRVFPATGSAFLTRCSPAGGNQLEFNVWKVHAPVGHQPTYTETLVGDPCLYRGSGAPSQTLSFVTPTHVLTQGCGGKMSHEVVIDFFHLFACVYVLMHACQSTCVEVRGRGQLHGPSSP